jgi:hypothetical protein
MSGGGLNWIHFPASIIGSGTLDGDRLPAISTTKKGGAPATGSPSGKFLKDDNSWSAVPAGVSAASQGEVDTGSEAGKYVAPSTLASAAKWLLYHAYTLLTDSASIAADALSVFSHYMWLSTAQSTITLTLSNVVANSVIDITVKKTISGTCSITLAGTGLTWKGYNNSGYGASPIVILSGATNDYFTISIKFDKDKCGIVAVGSNAN